MCQLFRSLLILHISHTWLGKEGRGRFVVYTWEYKVSGHVQQNFDGVNDNGDGDDASM